MLLSIDQNKIVEQLAKSPPAYTVTPNNLEPASVGYEPPTAEVHSTATLVSPDVERARRLLLTLRERVIENGRKPLSADELEREIDETRGRS